MKKTNLLKGAMSILAASVLLASCTQLDSRIDTVDTLETPSVKAVAYPGMNVITWDSVKGALKYKVTRVIDGVEEVLEEDVSKCYHADVYPSDKVEVEYRVYAISKANPSKAVFVYDSKAGSTKVETIFPPAGTKSIDLPKYEKDSGYNFEDETKNKEWKDEFIPTKENIKVELVDDNIVITAPQKAYLDTKFMFDDGTKNEIFGWDDSYEDAMESLYRQNKKWSLKKKITKAGEVKVGVSVKATSSKKDKTFYKQTDFDLDPITIPSIKISKATQITLVDYIDDAKTNARIEFMPAVSKDGATTFAVADYKVYRALAGSNDLVEVKDLKADSRTINNKTEVVYYVEDKVPSNKVAYDYYVVLSKDNKFESTNNSRRLNTANFVQTVGGYAYGYTVTLDEDKKVNDVVVVVKPGDWDASSKSKIVAVSYALSKDGTPEKVLDSEFKAVEVEPKLADKQMSFYVKDVDEEVSVIVKAEFAETNSEVRDNKVVVTNVATVSKAEKAEAASISIAWPSQEKGDKDLLRNDWKGNKIKLADKTELVSVKYAFAKNQDLAKVAAINGTDITPTVKDYTEGKDYDYIFDILDKGEIGQFLAIAVEVKAENKENTISVNSYDNSVSVNYQDFSAEIAPANPTTSGTKTTVTLNLDLKNSISDDYNSVDNYKSIDVTWIKAKNENYEISETTKWEETKSYKISDFTKGKNSNYYTMTIPVAVQTYDTDCYMSAYDYYVIKVTTKYANDKFEEREPKVLHAKLKYYTK